MSTPHTTTATTSTSTAAPSPQPLRERAFALACQGLRSPAIAATLGVSARTVRAWIAAALKDLAAEQLSERKQLLALALARQEALLAAAWAGYERAATFEQAALIQQQHGTFEELVALPPRFTAAGARYLSLIQAAQREIARLQGLYEHVEPDPPHIRITISPAPGMPGDLDPATGETSNTYRTYTYDSQRPIPSQYTPYTPDELDDGPEVDDCDARDALDALDDRDDDLDDDLDDDRMPEVTRMIHVSAAETAETAETATYSLSASLLRRGAPRRSEDPHRGRNGNRYLVPPASRRPVTSSGVGNLTLPAQRPPLSSAEGSAAPKGATKCGPGTGERSGA